MQEKRHYITVIHKHARERYYFITAMHKHAGKRHYFITDMHKHTRDRHYCIRMIHEHARKRHYFITVIHKHARKRLLYFICPHSRGSCEFTPNPGCLISWGILWKTSFGIQFQCIEDAWCERGLSNVSKPEGNQKHFCFSLFLFLKFQFQL